MGSNAGFMDAMVKADFNLLFLLFFCYSVSRYNIEVDGGVLLGIQAQGTKKPGTRPGS